MKIKSAGLILLGLFSFTTQARWMTPEEAAYSIESQQYRVEIPEDAKAISEMKIRMKVMNETGRQQVGNVKFNYSPRSLELEVKRADIVNGGKSLKVDSNLIVDQAIRAKEAGFDDVRQILISYPDVQVGSELSYEIKRRILRSTVPGEFSEKLSFGNSGLAKNSETEITSARRLYFSVNDPTSSLEIAKSEDPGRKKFSYTIRLKKPALHQIFDEVNSLIDDRASTWVIYSTAADYPTLYTPMAKRYAEIIAGPLPERFSDLRDSLKDAPRGLSTIARLQAGLAERVRYMGDWRAVDGAYIPRSLEKIASTQSGDCKDMAVLLSRLLRELGYDASPALVFRGKSPPSLATVPILNSFNHAIVFVNLDGKKLWLDPTNFLTFPESVMEDIAERQALVLNPAGVTIEQVEFAPFNASVETTKVKIQIRKRETAVIDSEILQTGSQALSKTGALLKMSKSQFDEKIMSDATTRSELLSYKVDAPELKSRIVEPITLKLHFERLHRPVLTSMGPAFEFAPPDIVRELGRLDNTSRDSMLRLGPPSRTETVVQYEKLDVRGSQLKNCRAVSPWLEYGFSISQKPTKITREVTIKKFAIAASEIRSPEFAKFQRELRLCGRSKYTIFAQ